ncbi:hypothetical protein AEQU1_02797 [Aequorivita sp. CIP111184]|nr:hypothetical protein AEQU1_02797 [Aequorivita sp. CIP111184]
MTLFTEILLIGCRGSDDSEPTEVPINNAFTATFAEACITIYDAIIAKFFNQNFPIKACKEHINFGRKGSSNFFSVIQIFLEGLLF